MKTLFLGVLFNKDEEKAILQKSKVGLFNSVIFFQWNIVKGIEKVLEKSIDIVNVLPVGTYPKYYSDFVLKTKHWKHRIDANDLEVGSINIPFIKQFMRTIFIKKAIKKWINNNKQNDKLSIVIYTPYLPFLLAVKPIPRSIKVILIVTDLPEYYDLSLSATNKIKKLLRELNNKIVYKLLERIDGFIVLTEQMKYPLGIGNRPYIVIEGLVGTDSKFTITSNNINTKKIILYAGTLHYQFGIKNLLNAFSLIDCNDYELWICGMGEAVEEIINMSKIDKRVKYLGYVTKKEIYELQQQATLLINPRTNEGKYTKYSFPSKTMDYMLSGKPVLIYKLDGVPDEYDEYLYYFDSSNPEEMAERIMEICEKPKHELEEFGKKAREFVLKNKNNVVQAKKIIDMIEMMHRKG